MDHISDHLSIRGGVDSDKSIDDKGVKYFGKVVRKQLENVGDKEALSTRFSLYAPSVTLTMFFLGYPCLGTFALELLLGNLCLGTFAWELSLGNLCLGTFVWELSPGNFRLGTSAWELSLGNFRLGTFAWELPLGNFCLGTFAWELWRCCLKMPFRDAVWSCCLEMLF